MRYPQDLVERFGEAQAFAEAASKHPLAPRKKLDRAAVYMWKRRDTVPYMWRPVVEAMRSQSQEAAE